MPPDGMAPGPAIGRRRSEFLDSLTELEHLGSDALSFAQPGGPWASVQWRLGAVLEMLAVRAYTEWEGFSHQVLILSLARDTSKLAATTGLSLKPKRISADMAEALLTARRYIEFNSVDDLISKARLWLAASPFD